MTACLLGLLWTIETGDEICNITIWFKIQFSISVVSGPGHPDYPGHLGHILSGSSGSYPLH